MTLSAMVRSEYTISAVTAGSRDVELSWHEMSPLWPSESVLSLATADSISAAVVPGAKLVAMTVKGPAAPFMEMPRDLEMLAWLEEGESTADRRREVREASEVDEGREGGCGRVLMDVEEEERWRGSIRS